MLKDPPNFKEVAKIFVVGLTLRSYVLDNGNGSTCLGHELSRRICLTVNNMMTQPEDDGAHRRRSWLMSPERLRDCEAKNKKRELNQSVQQFAVKTAQVTK